MAGTSSVEPQQPENPAASGTASGTTGSSAAKTRRLSRKKIWTSILLLVATAGLTVGAVMFYNSSAPSELPAPSYVTIALRSSFPVGIIGYSVTQNAKSATIEITVLLSQGVTPSGTPSALLKVTPPGTTGFLECPNVSCAGLFRSGPGSGTFLLTRQLTFRPGPTGVETASASFSAGTQAFGDNSNGVNASAAVPQVFYQCACLGSSIPILQTQYTLHSANSYDWASFPVQTDSDASATWEEPVVPNGETPGRVALGVDDAAQSRDQEYLFIAGALIGLAGGAFLSAVTEAADITDGDRSCPLAPNRASQA